MEERLAVLDASGADHQIDGLAELNTPLDTLST
jgi:hypothetical protein